MGLLRGNLVLGLGRAQLVRRRCSKQPFTAPADPRLSRQNAREPSAARADDVASLPKPTQPVDEVSTRNIVGKRSMS